MGVYRIPAEAIERRERRMRRLSFLISVGYFICSVGYSPAVAFFKGKPVKFLISDFVSATILVLIWIGILWLSDSALRMREKLQSFELEIHLEGVARRGYDLPPLTLLSETIKSADDRGPRGIRLKTGVLYRTLDIPNDIENYQQCLAELAAMGIPFRKKWSLTGNDGNLGAGMAFIISFSGAFYSDKEYIALGSAILTSAVLLGMLDYERRSPNVKDRFSQMCWTGGGIVVMVLRAAYILWHPVHTAG